MSNSSEAAKKRLANDLREYLDTKGWVFTDLEEKTTLNKETLRRAVNESKGLKPDNLKTLCDKLGWDIELYSKVWDVEACNNAECPGARFFVEGVEILIAPYVFHKKTHERCPMCLGSFLKSTCEKKCAYEEGANPFRCSCELPWIRTPKHYKEVLGLILKEKGPLGLHQYFKELNQMRIEQISGFQLKELE